MDCNNDYKLYEKQWINKHINSFANKPLISYIDYSIINDRKKELTIALNNVKEETQCNTTTKTQKP